MSVLQECVLGVFETSVSWPWTCQEKFFPVYLWPLSGKYLTYLTPNTLTTFSFPATCRSDQTQTHSKVLHWIKHLHPPPHTLHYFIRFSELLSCTIIENTRNKHLSNYLECLFKECAQPALWEYISIGQIMLLGSFIHMRHKTPKTVLPVLTWQAPGPLAQWNIQLTTDKHRCFWIAVHLWWQSILLCQPFNKTGTTVSKEREKTPPKPKLCFLFAQYKEFWL